MNAYPRWPGRLLRWLLVAPAALAAVAAVLVGAPVALLALGGNPIPEGVVSLSSLWELLTTPDDGRLLLWALSVVGWLAWAAVASSLVLEIGAQLLGRRTPRVPGLAGPQRLAGLLVAGVLAALTSPGVSHANAAYLDVTVHADYLDPALRADPAPGPAARGGTDPAPVVHTVQRGEGLVDIAQRYQVTVDQLAIANHHRPQPDGLSLRPGELRVYPGWQLVVPNGQGGGAPAAAQPDDGVTPDPDAPPDEASGPLVHEVAEGDWMWHIAGRYLGDELRYPEIAALNPSYAQRYADFPDHIQPGDQLVLPPDAYDRGERPHATGDVVPAEVDEAVPPESEPPDPAGPEDDGPDGGGPESGGPEGGGAGTNPEAPPRESAPAAPAPAPTPTAPAAPAVPAPPPVPPPPATTPPAGAAPPPAGPASPAEEAGKVSGAAAAPDPPGAGAAEPAPGEPASGESAEEAGVGVSPLVATGVLASVLLGALLVYRWRKMAYRRRGRAIVSRAAASTESALRAAATADTARVDQALRLLSARPKITGEPPDIGAVWISGEDIHLVLAGAETTDPPPPFETGARGTWVLPGDAVLPEVSGAVAPLPALVTLGSQPGQHLLVDLERIGMLTITGPPERTSDLLRYLVAELAHNPWSDLVEVTVAGFGDEQARQLAALNPSRITVATSLAEAVAALRRRVEHTTAALEAHGLADSLQGRIRDTATDTWAPQLLVINQPPPEQEDLLLELADSVGRAARRCAVAVVASTHPPVGSGRRTVTITDDGMLSAAFLDDSHPLPAVGLPAELLGPFTALVHDATSPEDHPIPAATEPWAAGTDATGRPIADPTGGWAGGQTAGPDDDATGGTAERAAAASSGPVTPPAAPAATTSAGPARVDPAVAAALDEDTPVQPLRVIAGPAAATGPAEDPELDAAVAAWWAGAIQPPRVAILGPVEVTAPGQYPSHRTRVCQELVVFLAARGAGGVDAAEITRQLWPQQQVPPTLRTAVIMSVRRWLGTGPDGEQWLSEAVPDGRYRLRDGLLVDWHLFRRLRARGERRGAAGAADLRAALRLVRGAPLPEAGQRAGLRVPYSWLPGSPFAPELIVAGVVDTAHRLVDLSLAAGDLATARWAVHQAWLADPRRTDDHPWQDLMRIAHAQGAVDQVRAILDDLLRWRDAEHPDELAPATRELVASLLEGRNA